MAILEREDSGARCFLLARHLVGRSRLAHLCLREPNVSGEHAVLCWTGSHWEVHDLGSRNGTFVDGVRIAAGERVRLQPGTILELGKDGNRWRLVDDGPPSVMAVPDGGGAPRAAEGGFLALPDASEPLVICYQDRGGDWRIEREGAIERARNGMAVVAGAQRFVLHLPESLAPTWESASAPPTIERIALRFAVSRDEEYVELAVLDEAQRIDLGARAHHYLLLTLARARLRDREAQAPAEVQGWLYQEELSRMLDLDEKHLNVAVFRCRQQIGAAGVVGAAEIIERRRPTRQLRLGVERVEIVRI